MALHPVIFSISISLPQAFLRKAHVAIFYGIAAIWERDLGILQRACESARTPADIALPSTSAERGAGLTR